MSFLASFLRVFFDQLYHRFAWTYDWVAAIVSVGLWKEWVLAIIPEIGGPRVLELGHGPGHLQAALFAGDFSVTGLDASPQMGRLASKRLKKKGFSPMLVQARAQSLPFSSGSFQHVVSTFPTEYIADPQTLNESWRVLVPGGRLTILPVAWINGRSLPERMAAWLFRITKQAPGRLPPRAKEEASDEIDLGFPLVAAAKRAGFRVQVDRQILQSSILVLVRAEKSNDVSPFYNSSGNYARNQPEIGAANPGSRE